MQLVRAASLDWGRSRTFREAAKGSAGHDGAGEDGAEADREQDQPAGDVRQAPERAAQEGVRAVAAVRRRGRAHHLLRPRPPLRVLQLVMVRRTRMRSPACPAFI